MLQHMLKTQILDLILRRMNPLIRIPKRALDDKGRRIPRFTRARVVATRVAAFCEHVWDVAVFDYDLLDEVREALVHEIGDHADGFRFPRCEGAGDVAGHVLLEHGLDVAA